MTATDYLNDLNQRYLAIHRTKEDFFWETYMGISDSAPQINYLINCKLHTSLNTASS